jgi:hypothetical protein
MELTTSQFDTNSVEENLDFKIYKIYSDQTDKVYIGSTKQPLWKRFSVHKSEAKRTDKKCTSRVLLNEFTDCRINLIENCSKENKVVRERYWIEHYGERAVNGNLPGRSQKERTHQHADEIKEWQKEYHHRNADQIKAKRKEYYHRNADQIKAKHKEYSSTKITCACGAIIRIDSKSKHLRSKKHTSSISNE